MSRKSAATAHPRAVGFPRPAAVLPLSAPGELAVSVTVESDGAGVCGPGVGRPGAAALRPHPCHGTLDPSLDEAADAARCGDDEHHDQHAVDDLGVASGIDVDA